MISLSINGRIVRTTTDPRTPLLWVLRDEFGFKGVKFGCGRALCGACTIHVNGEAVRSCSMLLGEAEGTQIVTIEGLGTKSLPHPVQKAWIDHQVPQCGYCQPGFVMAVAALLSQNPTPTDENIEQSITNICRCGTYDRIRKAIRAASEALVESGSSGQR
jgi:isoquinoline 1-oxidoreductase subunit alpha